MAGASLLLWACLSCSQASLALGLLHNNVHVFLPDQVAQRLPDIQKLALKKSNPEARRSDASAARPLPRHVRGFVPESDAALPRNVRLAVEQSEPLPLRWTSSLPDSCPSSTCVCESGDEGWYLPYPCNCHWYYECQKEANSWNTKMFDCGDWVFDPNQAACVWPELAPPELCDNPDCNNCPLPCQTSVNGQCSPECCEDDDCPDDKPLCNGSGVCQIGCRQGSDCDGYNTECHSPWQTGDDNCEYCDNMDNDIPNDVGQCQPGCEGSSHDMCPGEWTCAGQHNCVSGGATLLKRIHLTTSSCEGCSQSDEGAQMAIHGIKQDCLTSTLDHEIEQDYVTGYTAIFASVDDVASMGQCNNAELAGGPKTAELTWKGVGSWTPSEVKIEVSRDYYYKCEPQGGLGTIEQGETVSLTCVDA